MISSADRYTLLASLRSEHHEWRRAGCLMNYGGHSSHLRRVTGDQGVGKLQLSTNSHVHAVRINGKCDPIQRVVDFQRLVLTPEWVTVQLEVNIVCLLVCCILERRVEAKENSFLLHNVDPSFVPFLV
jgi:hypothetical protein